MKIHMLAGLGLLSSLAIADDGALDTAYGDQGRNATGFVESDTIVLRDVARSSANGKLWKFSDDRDDPLALYLARTLPTGQPDPAFGPNADGRRRTLIPPGLVASPYRLDLAGASLQSDGKPLIYGGLPSRDVGAGAFPALVCRLAVAGNLDGGYGTGGCRTLRAFLADDETCRVSDVATSLEGMLVVVGNCRAPDLVERPFLARLTSAGALDLEFAAGAGLVTPLLPIAQARHRFRSVASRPDGRIVVLGEIDRDLGAGLRRELALWQFDGGGSPDAGFGDDGLQSVDFAVEGFPIADASDLDLGPDGRLVALGQALRSADDARVALLTSLDASGLPLPGFGDAGKRVDTLADSVGPASALQRLALDGEGRAIVAATRVEGSPDARSQAGTDFWFQFALSVPPLGDVRLRISGDVATTGVVTSPFEDTSVPFQVQPGEVTEVSLTELFNVINTSSSLAAVAVRVSTDAPVVVVPFSGRFLSASSNASLPVTALGRDYRVQTWGTGLGAGSHLVVVAAAPGSTAVAIRSPVAAGGTPADTPIQVTLQQGEAFHLAAEDGADISGALVSSDRPVAVYGGHTCANVPNLEVEFCDQVFEQMDPLDRWGTDFVAVPFAARSGDILRVLAHEAGTEVEIDGDIVATLAAGESHTFARSTPVRIRTSRPASVAQVARGCKADQVGELCFGDPAMLDVPPRSRWGSRRIAILPDYAIDDVEVPTTRRFIGIVAPLAAVGAVTLDGVPIPAQAFTAVGDGRHAQVQLERPAGVDVVAAPLPIFAWVYGFANSQGYAHEAANAPASDEAASSDDMILRFLPDGRRDDRFGLGGLALFDHAPAFQTALPSFDAAVRALPDGDGIVVGSASVNRASGQSFALGYRIVAADIFRDGFEDAD